MEDQYWQPDRETRAAIRRGDKLNRAYFKRKSLDYQLMLIGRLIKIQQIETAEREPNVGRTLAV